LTHVRANICLSFFMSAGFLTGILNEATPSVTRHSRSNQIVYAASTVAQIAFILYWITSASSRAYIVDIAIDIPEVGRVSVFQRTAIAPSCTLALFFLKNLFMMWRHPNHTVTLGSAVKEFHFCDQAAFAAFLEERDTALAERLMMLERSIARGAGLGRTVPRRRSKLRYFRSAFKPILINAHDSIATMLVGQANAVWMWSVVKLGATKYFLLCANFAGQLAFCLVFIGVVDRRWVLLAIPGSAASLIGLLFLNVSKTRLLLQCFVPLYLICAATVLSFGMCWGFRGDVRAAGVVQLFASLLAGCLFSAQTAAMRRFAALHFVSGIAILLAFLAAVYLGKAHDFHMTQISLPGAVVSVSSTQAFVVTPIMTLLPYFLRFLLVGFLRPGNLQGFRAPLMEVVHGGAGSATEYMAQRKQSILRTMVNSATNFVKHDTAKQKVVPLTLANDGQAEEVEVYPIKP